MGAIELMLKLLGASATAMGCMLGLMYLATGGDMPMEERRMLGLAALGALALGLVLRLVRALLARSAVASPAPEPEAPRPVRKLPGGALPARVTAIAEDSGLRVNGRYAVRVTVAVPGADGTERSLVSGPLWDCTCRVGDILAVHPDPADETKCIFETEAYE